MIITRLLFFIERGTRILIQLLVYYIEVFNYLVLRDIFWSKDETAVDSHCVKTNYDF